jgi:aspartyl-tRNA(Asn)/glutamyl-tRNA(Gln) amidotransferase subunit B
VDYNRSGIPLVEIVTEPDFSSPEEARTFLQKLAEILEYLGLYDPFSRAVFKSDANISLIGGERIEIKNITGTKEIEHALKYEIVRQGNMLKRGVKIVRETRAWNPDTRSTMSLRGKEEAAEYGYIFEPDLTRIEISRQEIVNTEKELPELPDEKKSRYIREFKITGKLAESLVSDPQIASFFEEVSKKTEPKLAASWMAGPLKKTLNWYPVRLGQTGLTAESFVSLLGMFERGEITDRNAELVIRKMVEEKKTPAEIVKKYGLGKVSAKSEIELIINNVIGKNHAAVNDYRSGGKKALHFLVGQVMKESKGKIDPKVARKLIEEKVK